MLRKSLLGLVLAFTVAGCAQTASRASDGKMSGQCFSAASVRGFAPVDDNRIQIQVGVRDVYELTLLNYCPDIDWSHTLGLRTRSGSSMICTSDPYNIELHLQEGLSPMALDHCRVREIRKLTSEQAQQARSLKGRKSVQP